jgi:glycerol-3-phosphate dehydrogenase
MPQDRIVVISGEGSADDVEARMIAEVTRACSTQLHLESP